MKLDKDSYYIKYWVTSDGSDCARMTHYIDVWDNGFFVDTYCFSQHRISFEDASWNGVNPDDSHEGKRILKRYYDRWAKRVIDCKTRIEQLANENASPYDNNWSIGDCLYIPLKEIYAKLDAEEMEEGIDVEDVDEAPYDGPEFCLVQITNGDPDKLEGLGIHIDKNWVRVDSHPNPIPYMDFMEQALHIPQNVFESAKNLISSISSEIIEEIKRIH